MAPLEENDIDLEFLNPEDGFSCRPPKHWCFFADIIYNDDSLRLKFIVEDNPSQWTPVMFCEQKSEIMIEMPAAAIGAADND